MDSNPPATTMSDCSKEMDCAPYTTLFNPDEHTLLIVVQGTFTPIPPLMEACLAGACPNPAPKTFPSIT